MLDSLLFALFYWARYSILEKYHMNNKVGGDGRNLPATHEKAQNELRLDTGFFQQTVSNAADFSQLPGAHLGLFSADRGAMTALCLYINL